MTDTPTTSTDPRPTASRMAGKFAWAQKDAEARLEADLPPYPFAMRAVIILGLAAALWAGVWIVARGAWWIWRAWQ